MKISYFIAASFVAAIMTGCPGPNPPSEFDGGPLPGDASRDTGTPDIDGATPMDAGDSGILTDAGEDAGLFCRDTRTCPDGFGCYNNRCIPFRELCYDTPDSLTLTRWECALPEGMVYNRSEFLCADVINSDCWGAGSGTIGVTSDPTIMGYLLSGLEFALANNLPVGDRNFVCGNEGKCWMNWRNPDSMQPRCLVTFSADCVEATVECWEPGDTSPTRSMGYYCGPI